jgi:hypothetical protein
MHKNATKCNETLSKWCKNKHGASKIMDTFETYHPSVMNLPLMKAFWQLSISLGINSSDLTVKVFVTILKSTWRALGEGR